MGLFDFLGFGNKRKETILDFKNRNAIVVDVRSKMEFTQGKAPNSINIPLEQFQSQIKGLKKKNKPVLLCCRSGARSGQATRILSKHDVECFNAGAWQNLL